MRPVLDPEQLATEQMATVAVRIPHSLLKAIDYASRQRLTNRSDWLRQLAYRELQSL
jgi:metal-responsive CopG/Arc/MetJ family transcriptional regulator